MKIKILSDAENDIEEGYRFYESQDPGLGSYFLDSLYSDIDSLAYFGGMHRVVMGHHRLLAKRFPFAVYYRQTMSCFGFPGFLKNTATRICGFVDASIVAMAERLKICGILTTDRRHFAAVKPEHCKEFTLLPMNQNHAHRKNPTQP